MHLRMQKRMGTSITEMIEGFSKNQLVAYFLIIWLRHSSSVQCGFLWIAEGYGSRLAIIVDILLELG